MPVPVWDEVFRGRIRRAGQLLGPQLPQVLDEFQAWCLSPDGGARWATAEQHASLRTLQSDYWRRLFSEQVGDDYVQALRQLGQLCRRDRLSVDLVLSAIWKVEQLLLPTLRAAVGGAEELEAIERALKERLLFDATVIVREQAVDQEMLSGDKDTAVALHQALTELSEGHLTPDVPDAATEEVQFLADAVQGMSDSLTEVVRQVRVIAAGDYRADIAPRSDKDELGLALQDMTRALRDLKIENERRVWIIESLNGLFEAIRGSLSLKQLGGRLVSYLAQRVSAQLGAVHVFDAESELLTFVGSYAYSIDEQGRRPIALGEGLVGQVALERKALRISDVPDSYVQVSSSLGAIRVRELVLAPLVFGSSLVGVVELGFLKPISGAGWEFLELAAEGMAVALDSARVHSRLEGALSESQALSEELERQQSQLMATNEELEEQTRMLREAEGRLKAQHVTLERANAELEEKNEVLQESQREIELKADALAESGRYKSEFLANMSHELRTPLNSMLLLARHLVDNQGGRLDEDEVQSAEIIYRSGNDLLTLINEILDLSKIEAGQMQADNHLVDVESIAEGVRTSFGCVADDKGLSLEVRVAGDVPEQMLTDRGKLQQIIRNIVANALKFTQTGGVVVDFALAESSTKPDLPGSAASQVLELSVKDTGIGIPSDQHQAVFEAFQQVEGGTDRKHGGTGLGLAISRELALLLGGELRLTSSGPEGSVFTLFMPMHAEGLPLPTGGEGQFQGVPSPQVRKAALSQEVAEQSVEDDRAELGDGDRVLLIIEDDVRFAGLVRDLARGRGFKCLVATTGEEGLALAESCLPHGILLDIQLPGIDGWTVLDSLKASTKTRHIPVHFVSIEDETLDAFRRGAVGYLQKPVQKSQLEAAIGELENVFDRDVKELLVVEDDRDLRQAIARLIGNGDTKMIEAESGAQALELLSTRRVDCMILDLGLPDMTGFELLEELKKREHASPPVIIYTGQELTLEQANELRSYSDSIIIKGVRSEERLLDETALFLHRVVGNLPEQKQRIIAKLHQTDELLESRRVLLVDDDMRNTFALGRVLSKRGVDVTKAENGQKALDLLDTQEFDLVLMDIMMPVMDGYEAIKRIRSNPELQGLPVIALTAKAMREDRQRCLEVGASDYLSKPVDVERLCSMMRVWLYR